MRDTSTADLSAYDVPTFTNIAVLPGTCTPETAHKLTTRHRRVAIVRTCYATYSASALLRTDLTLSTSSTGEDIAHVPAFVQRAHFFNVRAFSECAFSECARNLRLLASARY